MFNDQLSGGRGKPGAVAFGDFCGINTLMTVDSKLQMWCHWAEHGCPVTHHYIIVEHFHQNHQFSQA